MAANKNCIWFQANNWFYGSCVRENILRVRCNPKAIQRNSVRLTGIVRTALVVLGKSGPSGRLEDRKTEPCLEFRRLRNCNQALTSCSSSPRAHPPPRGAPLPRPPFAPDY